MKTAILLEELRQLTENDPAQTESYGPNKEHIIAQLVSDDEAPLNLRQELNDIFYYYSSFGQTDATDTLGSANFRRCVNDCRIPSTRIKPGEIDVLFCKAVGGSGKRMTFDLFCKALCLLSLRLYGEDVEPVDAMTFFLVKHVLLHCPRRPVDSAAFELLSDQQVWHVFSKYNASLIQIYQHYSVEESSSAKGPRGLSLDQFMSFAMNFNIFPSLISKTAILRYFRGANFGQLADDVPTHLSFAEFLECLARIAIHSYSQPPFSKLFPTNEQKVQQLFDKCFGSKQEVAIGLEKSGIRPIMVVAVPPVVGRPLASNTNTKSRSAMSPSSRSTNTTLTGQTAPSPDMMRHNLTSNYSPMRQSYESLRKSFEGLTHGELESLANMLNNDASVFEEDQPKPIDSSFASSLQPARVSHLSSAQAAQPFPSPRARSPSAVRSSIRAKHIRERYPSIYRLLPESTLDGLRLAELDDKEVIDPLLSEFGLTTRTRIDFADPSLPTVNHLRVLLNNERVARMSLQDDLAAKSTTLQSVTRELQEMKRRQRMQMQNQADVDKSISSKHIGAQTNAKSQVDLEKERMQSESQELQEALNRMERENSRLRQRLALAEEQAEATIAQLAIVQREQSVSESFTMTGEEELRRCKAKLARVSSKVWSEERAKLKVQEHAQELEHRNNVLRKRVAQLEKEVIIGGRNRMQKTVSASTAENIDVSADVQSLMEMNQVLLNQVKILSEHR